MGGIDTIGKHFSRGLIQVQRLKRLAIFFLAGLTFMSLSSVAAANYNNELDQLKWSYSQISWEQANLYDSMSYALDRNHIPVFVQTLNRYIRNIKNLRQMQEYIRNTNNDNMQLLDSMIAMDLMTYNDDLRVLSDRLREKTAFFSAELQKYKHSRTTPPADLKHLYSYCIYGQDILGSYFWEIGSNTLDVWVEVDNADELETFEGFTVLN